MRNALSGGGGGIRDARGGSNGGGGGRGASQGGFHFISPFHIFLTLVTVVRRGGKVG